MALQLDTSGAVGAAGDGQPQAQAFGDDDALWEMACETKKLGNKYVGAQRYDDAVHRYSEVIMQCRQITARCPTEEELEKVFSISFKQLRELVQACYLNLAM